VYGAKPPRGFARRLICVGDRWTSWFDRVLVLVRRRDRFIVVLRWDHHGPIAEYAPRSEYDLKKIGVRSKKRIRLFSETERDAHALLALGSSFRRTVLLFSARFIPNDERCFFSMNRSSLRSTVHPER
jgi:hypothetical protein